MPSRCARLVALVLVATGCSNVVRQEDGAGGDVAGTGGAGNGSADTGSGTGASLGGGGGAGGTDLLGGAAGAGGRASFNCADAEPGTFFIRIDLPDESYTLTSGCGRFPEFPFALYTLGGECGEGTYIAACSEEPGSGSFQVSTGLGEVGSEEVTGTFGSRDLLGNIFLSTFGEVGDVVSGELDGVVTNDPSGDQISFHAELLLCRLPDLPPCP
jgi:hypothetical protein